MRPAPSSAIASAGGLMRGEQRTSRCSGSSASSPVAAVSLGGRPSVSSGSQMARLGMRCGLMKPSLRPSSSVSSAARPTSAPGAGGGRNGDHRRDVARDAVEPAIDQRRYFERPSCVASSATPLARSIGEPPPSATIPSQPRRDNARARRRPPPRSGWAAYRGRAACPAAGSASALARRPAASTPLSATSSGRSMPELARGIGAGSRARRGRTRWR